MEMTLERSGGRSIRIISRVLNISLSSASLLLLAFAQLGTYM
jgi:hypothetical protein